MPETRDDNLRGRGWHIVVLAVLVGTLGLSVATRFWAPPPSQSHSASSLERRSFEPKRQHVETDTGQWIALTPALQVTEPAVADEAQSLPVDLFLPKHVFTESLYDRPPPSAVILL